MGATMFSNIPPVTKALLIANGVVFLLQQLVGDPAFAPFMLFGWLLIRHWRGQPPFGRGGPRRPRPRIVR